MRAAWLVVCCFVWVVKPVEARVERVVVDSRVDVLNGKEFGAAGAYERLTGKVYFSLAVANEHNRRIVDLGRALNVKDGAVGFVSDFIALRPKDAARGNGSMLFEVPNRGHSRIVSLVDGGDWNVSADAGDGWLLRNGFTVVALGWQWDAAGKDALKFEAPVARDNGKTITGLLRGDLMPSRVMQEIPLGHLITGEIGGTEYPVAAPEDARNVLTVRDARDAKRVAVPRAQWQFAHLVDGKLEPSDRFIHLDGGFQPGKIYEYVYVVKDPVVAGGGFAAVRDFASYAKHDAASVTPVKRVYGEGISQDGRFLRDFLYEGFNADEEGRIALDGVLAHVAGAGRGSFNYRFAQPSRDAQPTSSVDYPTDIFPFTDEPEHDPVTGETGGLLDRPVAEKVTPRIFFSNTSYEYWGRAAALISVSADGEKDASVSDTVRIYKYTGLQHFPGPFPPARGKGDLMGQEDESPLPVRWYWRAMIANMDAWVRNGTEPPASAYPKIASGELVSLQKYAFPDLPGVKKPHEANAGERLDFGPDWRAGILSVQPPKAGPVFPVLVPQVDADGNERDGVLAPEVAAPLATYAAWNLRDPSIGAPDQRVSFELSEIPFAKTEEERKRTGDPRLSVAERYRNRDEYMKRYGAAVDALVRGHYVLAEDRDAWVARGEREYAEATGQVGGPVLAVPAHAPAAR